MARTKVKVGVVGVGGMGSAHCSSCEQVSEVDLTAVCDIDAERAREVGEKYGVPHFANHKKLIQSGLVDAITIATPHYFHPPIAIDGFKAGLHVLSEKPIAVQTSQAARMIKAAEKSGKVFAVMFQQRTTPEMRLARQLIEKGVLGELRRTLLVMPTFRSQSYYDSGGWRATWDGEGGGPLQNQSPHPMDIFTLLGGMPSWVHGITKTLLHDIEVEDHAEALLGYKNGASGYFYVSTCECGPGSLMEFVGDKAKMRLEDGKLTVHEYPGGVEHFCRTSTSMWAGPEAKEMELKLPECESGHAEIIRNWARVILGRKGEKLISPGADGIRSLELANAIQLSSWTGEPVNIPIKRAVFDRELKARRETSTFRKKTVKTKRETDPRIG